MTSRQMHRELLDWLLQHSRNPVIMQGDLAAQIGANLSGIERLDSLVRAMGLERYWTALSALNDYGELLARAGLKDIPPGYYQFSDVMDDDGQGHQDILIQVRLTVDRQQVLVDFSGTANQVAGNINCPLSVAAAAVYYVFYCLMPPQTPACAGSFRPITLLAPEGCLLNARRPAAVAAGNVETSTRVVDAVLGALVGAIPDRIPAASHGSMNNIAMGAQTWDYYETVGGGMGAHRHDLGLDGVQTHMTNTRNTPIEVVERNYPLRITRYALRDHSGGPGLHRGGHGLIREFEFLAPTSVTVLGERRTHRPWGLAGGAPGEAAVTLVNGQPLPGKTQFIAAAGDRLTLMTAGGGGWGACTDQRPGPRSAAVGETKGEWVK
jgi:N-methylhydantoinase B